MTMLTYSVWSGNYALIIPKQLRELLVAAGISRTFANTSTARLGCFGATGPRWARRISSIAAGGQTKNSPRCAQRMTCSSSSQAVLRGALGWFTSQKDIKFLQSERLVYFQMADYVGLCDKVLMIDGKKTVVDYKTGKGIYSEHFYQLSGYWLAIEEDEERVPQGLILHLNKETGEFKTYPVTNDQHQANFPIFLNLVEVKRREKAMQQELAPLFKTA